MLSSIDAGHAVLAAWVIGCLLVAIAIAASGSVWRALAFVGGTAMATAFVIYCNEFV